MSQPTNPLDLEAIDAMATKSPFPYHDLGKLLAEIIPALTAENRRLREEVTRLKAATCKHSATVSSEAKSGPVCINCDKCGARLEVIDAAELNSIPEGGHKEATP